MRTADYSPDAIQHVMKRKRRHGRPATECGMSRSTSVQSFVSPDLATADAVVAEYPGRLVCRECRLAVEMRDGGEC